ncbi:MAG: LysR family transcriptional regulator [Jatrophihabitans sp.]
MGAQDLSFRHLLALQAVHEQGSYRRAADALGYSQAAITQQIAALEKALGARVFNRHAGPRPVTLSPVGVQVLAAAADLLARADLLDARVEQVLSGRWGRLAVGTFQSISATLLPGILAQTREQEPDVDLSVFESRDNAELIAGIVAGRLDASFLVGPVTDARLTIHEVCRDPFVVLLPATAPGPTSIRLVDLADTPIIGHETCVCHEMVEQGFRTAGVQPNYVFRTNDNAAVQAMVRAGIGTAVMPLLAINTLDPTTRIVALEPPLPERSILIAVPKNQPASTATRFVERSLAAGLAVLPASG